MINASITVRQLKAMTHLVDESIEIIGHLEAVNADLLAALRTVLDQVDYMADPPNCRLNEMVGAVLPQEVIALARAAIARADPPGTDQGKRDVRDAPPVPSICPAKQDDGKDAT